MAPKNLSLISKKSEVYPWLMSLIAGLFFFYEFVQITIFNTISTAVMQSFVINATALSNLSATYYYSNVIFLIPAGLMLDRFSPKKLIVISMAISIVGTLIFAVSNSFAIAEISRAISGFGGAFAFISCIRVISRWIDLKHLSFAIGCLITMGFLGGITAQLPFAIINHYFSWRGSLFFVIGLGIIFLTMIIFFLKDKESVRYEAMSLDSLFSSLKIVTSNKQTWLAGCYISLMNLPIIILAALWSNIFLEQSQKITAFSASFITSLLFLGIMIGSPLIGWITDKIQKRRTVMFWGAALSTITLIAIMLITKNIYMLAILFTLLGLFSSTQCLGYPAIVENNPSHVTAIASSIGSMLVLGGGALLKVLFGLILDLTWNGARINGVPYFTKANFEVALLLLIAGFIVSLVLSLFIKERSI